MSALKVERVLVAFKATVNKNVNSHWSQDIASSENYHCQLRQLTESIASSKFQVALNDMLPTLIAAGKHSVCQVSALKVDRILVGMKTMIHRNLNSHVFLKNSLKFIELFGKHEYFLHQYSLLSLIFWIPWYFFVTKELMTSAYNRWFQQVLSINFL